MRAAKRGLDMALGALLSLLAFPIVMVLAVGVLVTFRTWPFFTQARVGRGGRTLRIVKIRTLPPTTPRYASKHEIGEPPALCAAMRRLHLDELPQLLLVVVGSLSLVGPRPEMPFLADGMEPGFAWERTGVRPGCTGLWQISAASDRPIADAPQYDRWYIAEGNFRMDAWIMWRTIRLMCGLGGPAGLDDIPRWATWRSGTPQAAVGPVEQTAAVADAAS